MAQPILDRQPAGSPNQADVTDASMEEFATLVRIVRIEMEQAFVV
ncbi:hypothetical protein SAMN04487912_12110 [Arthrobacter sp. cf158]|nr:hypothetical protein SAMN04487912_12110 [Arthrobacter sp. cf158]